MSVNASAITARSTHDEYKEDAARVVLPALVACGVLLFWLAEAVGWPIQAGLLGGLVIGGGLAGLALIGRRYRAAMWAAVLAVGLAVYLAVLWFPSADAACLFIVPVSLAALLIDVQAASALAGTYSLLAWQRILAPSPADGALWLTVTVALWTIVLLAWLCSRCSFARHEALWASCQTMQQQLDQAREQRVELKETKQDLIATNAHLARLTDRLADMSRMADDMRRAKEEFVANVSHELRTPLNMIIGFSEMISQQPETYGASLPPALLADIAIIKRNSEHLSALVDDVLDLSQMDAGYMAMSREELSLDGIIESALVAVRPLFAAKQLYLKSELAADLPPVYADRTRLRQVLLNIISNAGRFTERGGVYIRAQRDGEDAVVQIADTGPGIAFQAQSKIFEPFQQVDGSIRRRYGGTGLGLAISRRLVELHGGKMWLESEVGKGSVFFVRLPGVGAPAPRANDVARWFSEYQVYQPRTRPSRAPAPAPTPRLVVLEPGNALRRLLGSYLQGVEIVWAQDPPAALREMQSSPPQALVVNNASLQTAPQLAMQMTGVPLGTPVIHCWVPGEEEAAGALGVVAYLMKPLARETLLSTLDRINPNAKTILLVDDQQEVLQLYSRMLRSAGKNLRILRASTGVRALTLLREQSPDIMILDLVMPGMDGYEVLEKKRSDPQLEEIPVVVVSAQDAMGQGIISNMLAVQRGGGLSARDLLLCTQVLSRSLAPAAPSIDQEPLERTAD